MKVYTAPEMHSAEHLLSQTMMRMFGCGRCVSSHIEKKRSKCDYRFARTLTDEEAREIEVRINDVIKQGLPVSHKFVTRAEAEERYHCGRLPNGAGERIRIVMIGDYDACPCIGEHVDNTDQIGTFKITTWTHENGTLRIRFKLM